MKGGVEKIWENGRKEGRQIKRLQILEFLFLGGGGEREVMDAMKYSSAQHLFSLTSLI